MTYTLTVSFNKTSMVNTLANLSLAEVEATIERLGRQRRYITFSLVEE